jgi:hypothetical protein
MTLNQRIAHIVIHWIAPRLKREGKTWAECPIPPAQIRLLAERMTLTLRAEKSPQPQNRARG